MSARRFLSTYFNSALKQQQRANARRHCPSTNFKYLSNEVANRVVDRLQDISRDFPLALDLTTSQSHSIYDQLIAEGSEGLGGIKKLVQYSVDSDKHFYENSTTSSLSTELVIREEADAIEALPFPSNHFDLCLTNLTLHWINDLPALFKEVRRVLKPDGVFLGSMVGSTDTLRELRSSLILAEQERYGGVASHLSPMTNVSDVGMLLQSAGFNIPTVDMDTIQVDYDHMFDLVSHLQGMGENHAAAVSRNNNTAAYTGRDSFLASAAIYQESYGNDDDKTVPATFQILYMIGWKPHESQQKALKRGSAKLSLKDELKN